MTSTAPFVLAFDGSELSAAVVTAAADQLAAPRPAIVVCVWQPAELGFTPVGGQHFDADDADAVREAAQRTAEHGAHLATAAGFTATALAVEASSAADGLLAAAEQAGADLIVVGARQHGKLASRLLGHVAPSVLAGSQTAVLVVHERA